MRSAQLFKAFQETSEKKIDFIFGTQKINITFFYCNLFRFILLFLSLIIVGPFTYQRSVMTIDMGEKMRSKQKIMSKTLWNLSAELKKKNCGKLSWNVLFPFSFLTLYCRLQRLPLTRAFEGFFFCLFKADFPWTSINCFHGFPRALAEKVPWSLNEGRITANDAGFFKLFY